MSFPRGPRSTFAGLRPPPPPKGPPVLGVGSRVLVGANGATGSVTLTDENGSNPLGTLRTGLEVEIVAWRPRRGGDTRYRVVSKANGGIEGWLGAANLRARPFVPPPRPVQPPPPAKLVAPPKLVAPAKLVAPPRLVAKEARRSKTASKARPAKTA